MGERENESVMKTRPGIARVQQNPQFPQPKRDSQTIHISEHFFFQPWFLGKHALYLQLTWEILFLDLQFQ